MIRGDNEVFPRESYSTNARRLSNSWSTYLAPLIPSRSVNMTFRRNLRAFAATLSRSADASVLVIGAGSQKRWLDAFFGSYPRVRVVYSDIDVDALVDLFCDAHDLPFRDAIFDGVVASAVLEHVLYPERVAAEVQRVLSNGGHVYSELPFLQQVHEGAYDFTRYTLSGHRRLLNHFREVSSGVVAGPGTVLAWSLEHFALSLAPHRSLRTVIRASVRFLFFWLKYFDYLIGQSGLAVDGASCTYFLGVKEDSLTPDREIVARYAGSNAFRHV